MSEALILGPPPVKLARVSVIMKTRNVGAASRSEVAKRLGVSEAAVYAALTDRKTTICLTDETRERIQRAAREMGYEPSVLARSLVTRKSFLLSLLARSPIYSVLVPILEGAQNYLHDRDYSLITYYHGTLAVDEAEHLRRSMRRKVDGIITYPALDEDGATNAEMYRDIRAQGVPLVQIGHVVAPEIPAVVSDFAGASALAVDHLWQLGHRRIAILVHDKHDKEPAPGFWGDVVPLLAGYQAAMKARNQQPIVITRPMAEGTTVGKLGCVMVSQAVDETAAKVLSHPAAPTAVFTTSEAEGAALVVAFHRLGVSVPEEISVLSRFGHSVEEGWFEQTSLTGVGFQADKMGENAASLIFDLMEQKVPDSARRILIPSVFVPGNSSGPCRSR